MDFSIHPFIAWVIAWGATIGAVWFLFEKAEDTVTTKTRRAISHWLRNLEPAEALSNWPSMFATVFDRVFGERHLSCQCFWRSCVASLLAVALVSLVWGTLEFTQLTKLYYLSSSFYEGYFLLIFSLSIVVWNLIPDYLSLLESRYIIRWMSGGYSMVRVFAFLVFDFVATGIIFLVPYLGIIAALGEDPRLGFTAFLRNGPTLSSPVGILFYSTYVTSVWVWLYSLSGLVVKIASHFGPLLGNLKVILDIENKPLRSMGFVSIALVSLLYLAVPIWRLISKGT